MSKKNEKMVNETSECAYKGKIASVEKKAVTATKSLRSKLVGSKILRMGYGE